VYLHVFFSVENAGAALDYACKICSEPQFGFSDSGRIEYYRGDERPSQTLHPDCGLPR